MSKKHDLSHFESRHAPGMKVLGRIDDRTQIERGPTITCTPAHESGERLKLHTLVLSFAIEAQCPNEPQRGGDELLQQEADKYECAVLAHSDVDESGRWYRGITRGIDQAKILAGKVATLAAMPPHSTHGFDAQTNARPEDLDVAGTLDGVVAPGGDLAGHASRYSSYGSLEMGPSKATNRSGGLGLSVDELLRKPGVPRMLACWRKCAAVRRWSSVHKCVAGHGML